MKIESSEIDPAVAKAVDILKSGGLVAFPTETVYGLGADATNAPAVRRIFAAKGRPNTNPLIAHVPDATVAKRCVRAWPSAAEELARRFWPGPLTLVLPKSEAIVAEVTAGLPSVGVRAPDHPLALALLRHFDGPIAGPSANRANRVSPTIANHVYRELGDAVDLVLDGGPCQVGIESTVLDLTGAIPTILRLGSIGLEQLEGVIGQVNVRGGNSPESTPASSPGRQPVHYSPTAPAWRFDAGQTSMVLRWMHSHPTESATIIVIDQSPAQALLQHSLRAPHRVIVLPANATGYARQMYAALHHADVPDCAAIFIETPPQDAQWAAVQDRLRRATIAL